MSVTIYNKAFEVELSHDFYETVNKFNVNKYFEIVPTAACADLFSSGRMRMVRTLSGFTVFYQSYIDSSSGSPVEKPFVELSGDKDFVFAVRMKQEAMALLSNVTDLNVDSQIYGAGKVFFMSKDVTAYTGSAPYVEDLDATLLDQLRPSIFTYSFLPNTGGLLVDLIVNVYSENDLVTPVLIIDPVLVNPATGIYSVEVDLSKQPKGVYKIEALDGATVENISTLYVDSELARENVFGLIRLSYTDVPPELFYETCNDKEKFFTFNYAFLNRSVTWRYIVAVKLPLNYFTTSHELAIDDSDMNYTFSVLGGPTQPSPFSLNGFNTVVFTSDSPIPFKETPITTFSLKQTVVAPKTLMAHIPNAIPTGVDSDCAATNDGPFAEIFIVIDNAG
jgi:hypothetical protein